MGKLEGKTAVITAATSGMALATAKLFVDFIIGRRKERLDEAVKLIGKNVTGYRATPLISRTSTASTRPSNAKGARSTSFSAAPVTVTFPRSNMSPKSISIRLSTSTCAARSSPCRKLCRSSTTTAPSSSTAPLPASRASRHFGVYSASKPPCAPSRAPGLYFSANTHEAEVWMKSHYGGREIFFDLPRDRRLRPVFVAEAKARGFTIEADL